MEMNAQSRIRRMFLFGLSVALAPLAASALIIVGEGNKPVHDAGWPEGSLAVANLESRVGWWEGPPFGGGESHFLYRGDTESFTKALAAFSAIRAPAMDLIIHDGPEEDIFLKSRDKSTNDTRVDWTFTVWVPENWHRLYNDPRGLHAAGQPQFRQPVAAPRLDVYLGGGQVNWTAVEVPENVRVRDERASAAGADLSGGSVVRAEFFDMDTGKPVSGARVLIEKVSWEAGTNAHWNKVRIGEAISDSAGRAEIEKLPPHSVRISVTADGYAPRRLEPQSHTQPALLKFTVELAKAASIRGVVTDTEGKPIKGAKVRTQTELASNGFGYEDGRHYEPPDTWSVVTDAEGRFELAGLPTGYAQLYASAPGYHFTDHFTIYDVPSTNVVLRFGRAGGISVTVTDKSGKAISQFEGNPLLINVEPREGSKRGSWGGGATVKDDGTYQFENVPPGDYRINCHPNPSNSNRKYTPERIIAVKPGEPTPVKMVFE
jgi:hypothetical protein